jgi:glycosyltransferase involved in cell wall biosynthesis
VFDPEDRFMRPGSVRKSTCHLKKGQFDLVHIQTPFVAHYLGLELAKRLEVPCVETYHTFFEEYLFHYVPFLPKEWLRGFARRFSRTQCNNLSGLIVPSLAMREVLQNYGVTTPIKINPTGMELDRFTGGNGESFRKKMNIPINRPTMIFVGRVAFEKNIDFLLRVTNHVKKSIPDILFIIAGEGPALKHLKSQVAKMNLQDNILFVGYLDRQTELLDCYRAGDVFIFASRTETQGLVLLESMALGVPVVSIAVMGTKDILNPRKGALVAEENEADFSEKIISLLQNDVLRKRLSSEALEYVKTWSAPEMARRQMEFYESVISQATQQPNTFAAAQH